MTSGPSVAAQTAQTASDKKLATTNVGAKRSGAKTSSAAPENSVQNTYPSAASNGVNHEPHDPNREADAD